MATAPLPKITAASAAEICARFNLPPEAKPLLREGMPPGEFVDALIAHKQYVAGIDFLCHALPPREAVWWGCLCMQHASEGEFPPPEKAAAIAAVRWVLQPTEENRAAAKTPGEIAGAATPAGALAGAVNQTGAAPTPPDGPPSLVWAKTVATAVKLASIKGDPARILHRQRALLELGIGVAEGRYLN